MARFLSLFTQNNLLIFQFSDLVFVCLDHPWVRRIDDPLKQLINLPVENFQLLPNIVYRLLTMRRPLIPSIAEHRRCQLHHAGRRREVADNLSEVRFYLVALNRFSKAGTRLMMTAIIGVLFTGRTLRPARRQWVTALPARRKPSQHKIGIDVFARGCQCAIFKPLQNLLMGRKVNQPFMMPFAKRNTPFLAFHISRINRLLQKPRHRHRAQLTVWHVLGILRLAL
nr:hypothetical protein [uncultured Roseibium sp.]